MTKLLEFLKELPFNVWLMLAGICIALAGIGMGSLFGAEDVAVTEGYEMVAVWIGGAAFVAGLLLRIAGMFTGGGGGPNRLNSHWLVALLAVALLLLPGCSLRAELERPEDASIVRASETWANPITSFLTGGYRNCQLDLLDNTVQQNQAQSESGLALVEDYGVNLVNGDCTIVLRFQLPGAPETGTGVATFTVDELQDFDTIDDAINSALDGSAGTLLDVTQ